MHGFPRKDTGIAFIHSRSIDHRGNCIDELTLGPLLMQIAEKKRLSESNQAPHSMLFPLLKNYTCMTELVSRRPLSVINTAMEG
jgi:hypothetical protein